MFDVESIVRTNILNLKPYSSARDEFKGHASVFLDANENSFGSPTSEEYNRYPDPLQLKLKEAITNIKGIPAENIFLGNGSDEAIDILFRIFCEPGIDNVIICPPTYGMYEVSANINNVAAKKVNLTPSFELDVQAILENSDVHSKLLFICSPNNPTGNSLHKEDIELLIQKFNGIVVIDEAYINYAKQSSCIGFLTEYPNLVVLQTFSKAWGLAALRLGMAFASTKIIDYMNKVKPPYNINQATQNLALSALENINWVNDAIRETISEGTRLVTSLQAMPLVEKIFPSDANFLLVKVADPVKIYGQLVDGGIIVRNRNNITLCEGCLRITVGTPQQNEILITALQQIGI
ncbi:MAG: histidinol-phosphate transaminase [Bacteroidota bacterium]|nr:histidinol-phosphate transaminase [Bacteroidota bacterium]